MRAASKDIHSALAANQLMRLTHGPGVVVNGGCRKVEAADGLTGNLILGDLSVRLRLAQYRAERWIRLAIRVVDFGLNDDFSWQILDHSTPQIQA